MVKAFECVSYILAGTADRGTFLCPVFVIYTAGHVEFVFFFLPETKSGWLEFALVPRVRSSYGSWRVSVLIIIYLKYIMPEM